MEKTFQYWRMQLSGNPRLLLRSVEKAGNFKTNSVMAVLENFIGKKFGQNNHY